MAVVDVLSYSEQPEDCELASALTARERELETLIDAHRACASWDTLCDECRADYVQYRQDEQEYESAEGSWWDTRNWND